jgi:hypothetical protein
MSQELSSYKNRGIPWYRNGWITLKLKPGSRQQPGRLILFAKKAPGYILWPPHRHDPDTDNPKLRETFRRAILDSYKTGNRILFADETYGLSEELDLDRELISIWSRGGGMGCGLWAATQRPAYIPLWGYSAAEHVFLANDPDKRARIRYGEIGGINPKFVEWQVERLPKYHWLYIRRTGPATCIVEDK